MNNWELMKLAEKYDEDVEAIYEEENDVDAAIRKSETKAEKFKREYKKIEAISII
jgi:hypothetical protein